MLHKKILQHLSDGFTLVELLVVTSLSVLLMLTASSVFMTFMISDARTGAIGSVTDEGDYAMSQMEFLLRNAIEIVPNAYGNTCQGGMGQIRLRSYDNMITTLERRGDNQTAVPAYVASNSARLTSENILLTNPSEISLPHNPTFNCRQSTDGRVTYVEIQMVVEQPSVNFQSGSVSNRETFTTSVTLRSR